MMNQDQPPFRLWPRAATRVSDHSVTLKQWGLCLLAVCAGLILCPAPAQTQEPTSEPQGRQMRRYQAFARQAQLPPINLTNNTLLTVSETDRVDVTQLARLSSADKESLAQRFKVPAGVIVKLVQRAAEQPPADANRFAADLRTAVIDYQFLQGEWDRYHPPPEGQKVKADALAALQAGDILKAWALYDGLAKPQAPVISRPAPPANLRIVTQQ